jgi:hypothetical protein
MLWNWTAEHAKQLLLFYTAMVSCFYILYNDFFGSWLRDFCLSVLYSDIFGCACVEAGGGVVEATGGVVPVVPISFISSLILRVTAS